jgi:antitoxin HigA-1
MKRPPHPGRIIRQECIEPLDVTVTEAAARLSVTRQNLNNVLKGKSGISPEMAIRLSKAFGSRAEVWLELQMEYDLAEAEKTFGRKKGYADSAQEKRVCDRVK